jgi:hypothetical protein
MKRNQREIGKIIQIQNELFKVIDEGNELFFAQLNGSNVTKKIHENSLAHEQIYYELLSTLNDYGWRKIS